MERETPSYYGILPANVRYCKGLCPSAKILYTELSALTNKQGYCNASNNYFAQLYDVSERAISEWFKKLAQFGFIEIQIIRNENGTFRKIFLPGTNESSNGGMNKSSTPLEENFYTKEYYEKNTTSKNTTRNNNIKSDFKEKKENSTLIFPSEFSPQLIKTLTEFFDYKKEIKKPLKSQKSINALFNKITSDLKEYGEKTVIDSLYFGIANGWQGYYIKTNLNNNQKQNQNGIRTIESEQEIRLRSSANIAQGFLNQIHEEERRRNDLEQYLSELEKSKRR